MIRLWVVVLVALVLSGCAVHNGAIREGAPGDGEILSLNRCDSRTRETEPVSGRKYVQIGSAPVDSGRYYDPEKEVLFYFTKDTLANVEYKKKGKVSYSQHWIPEGTVGVADKRATVIQGRTVHKVLRICKCANGVKQVSGSAFYVAIASTTAQQSDANREKKCLTAGNVATGLGTGLLSFGFSTGEPISITAGAILSLTGLFDDKVYGSNSDQRCKAAFGIVGGIGGYLGGQSYNDAHKDDGSSGNGNDGNNNGNNGSDGPATPPPVP